MTDINFEWNTHWINIEQLAFCYFRPPTKHSRNRETWAHNNRTKPKSTNEKWWTHFYLWFSGWLIESKAMRCRPSSNFNIRAHTHTRMLAGSSVDRFFDLLLSFSFIIIHSALIFFPLRPFDATPVTSNYISFAIFVRSFFSSLFLRLRNRDSMLDCFFSSIVYRVLVIWCGSSSGSKKNHT